MHQLRRLDRRGRRREQAGAGPCRQRDRRRQPRARGGGDRRAAAAHLDRLRVRRRRAARRGGRARPYVESDPTGPRSVYGSTKLEGERQVLAASAEHTVVRTAWLYGVDGKNFVDTMLRLAGERDAVQVVDDQIGSPTWSGHLAPAILGLLEREVSGLVHLTGAGAVSWNGFAKEIFRQAEVDCRVEPASSEQMARPAPRPAYSVLESERDDVLPMPPWQDGLAGYLAARRWDDARMKLLVLWRRRGSSARLRAALRVQRAGRRGDGARQADLRGARGEPARGRRGAGLSLHPRRDRGSRGGRRGDRGVRSRGDRELRRRDACRPLDRRARRVREDARARHVRAAGGRARGGAALPAGLDRRGVRLDRGGLVHGGVAAAAVLAVLGDEDRARTCSCRATSTPTSCRR